jgi:hypothetical protein
MHVKNRLKFLASLAGFEPVSEALPLSYYDVVAEKEGFEPPRRSHALSVFKTDPFSRAWVFLRNTKRKNMVDPVGLEPTTDRL